MHRARIQIRFLTAFAMAAVAVVVALPASPASASGSITFRGAASAPPTEGTATLTIPKPTGLQEGDLMVAAIVVESGSDIAITPPSTTGAWTPILRTDQSTNVGVGTYMKFATSADVAATSYDWGIQGKKKASGGIMAYSGVDADTPLDVTPMAGHGASATSGDMNAPSLATVTPNARLIVVYGTKNAAVHSQPTGTAQQFQVSNGNGFASSGNDEERPVAGDTGSRTSTPSNGEWVAQSIALRPGTEDTTPPTVAVGFPTSTSYGVDSWDNGCSTTDGDICGTASDGSGVSAVGVSIRQGSGNYWDGDGFDSPAEVFNSAAGTNSWSYAFPAANFSADGSYTVKARAIDGATNTNTAQVTFNVDVTAPNTAIDAAPAATTTSRDADFQFSSPDPTADFQCRLDAEAFSDCSSPKSYEGLADGTHTFQVRAVDPAGNSDATPAGHTWTIDTAVPTVTIDSAPPAMTLSPTADLAFSSSDSDVDFFECRLDGGAWEVCTSPQQYQDLVVGGHTFEVRATDLTATTGPADSHDWTVVPRTPCGLPSSPGMLRINQDGSTINGTVGSDTIVAVGGSYTVNGNGGDDQVCTGRGADTIKTLGGKDRVIDKGGANVIRSGARKDAITTGAGNDRILTGRGGDTVASGRGKDRVGTGRGADTVKSGRGRDRIRAGSGGNNVSGGAGNDWIVTGEHSDTIHGGPGRDYCRAGRGRNRVRACERGPSA
jgi:hypothetical protein